LGQVENRKLSVINSTPTQNSIPTSNPTFDVEQLDFSEAPELGLFHDNEFNVLRFSCQVYEIELEVLECQATPRSERPKLSIETSEDLAQALLEKIRLWIKPFIHAIYDTQGKTLVLLDRGIRWTVFKRKLFFEALFATIPKKWVRVRKGRANHVVFTRTTPRDLPLDRAYKVVRRMFYNDVKVFKRLYGVKGYFAVFEPHEDGYPHLHGIIFLKKWVAVFKHKGIWRFVDKKRLWEKLLKTDERGFIDCFALPSPRHAVDYFAKYVAKGIPSNVFRLEGVFDFEKDERGVEKRGVNFKALAPFVFRLLNVRPFVISKSLRQRVKERLEQIMFERKRRELRKTIDQMNALAIDMEYLKHQDFDKYLQAFKRYMLLDEKRRRLLNDLIKKSATVSANGGSADQAPRSPSVVFMVWGYVECRVDVVIG
jgi:hypothetical protein